MSAGEPKWGLDHEAHPLPEFTRDRYYDGTRVVRRCGCHFGCHDRCPEAQADESTGLCTLCLHGHHLPKGAVVREHDVHLLKARRLADSTGANLTVSAMKGQDGRWAIEEGAFIQAKGDVLVIDEAQAKGAVE